MIIRTFTVDKSLIENFLLPVGESCSLAQFQRLLSSENFQQYWNMFRNRSCFWRAIFKIYTCSVMEGAGKKYILYMKTRILSIIAIHIDKHENHVDLSIDFRSYINQKAV